MVQTAIATADAQKQKDTSLLFNGLTWHELKTVEPVLDRPGYRLSFLDGGLEIAQVPSENHETIKKRIAALLELYLLQAGFDFTPTGSMTLEDETQQVRREADESYRLSPGGVRPDLAIEVVVTSGGLNKLEAYRRLQIAEVWFWEDGTLRVYRLRGEGDRLAYEEIDHSEALPNLDLKGLLDCINLPNHVAAMRVWQQAIQG